MRSPWTPSCCIAYRATIHLLRLPGGRTSHNDDLRRGCVRTHHDSRCCSIGVVFASMQSGRASTVAVRPVHSLLLAGWRRRSQFAFLLLHAMPPRKKSSINAGAAVAAASATPVTTTSAAVTPQTLPAASTAEFARKLQPIYDALDSRSAAHSALCRSARSTAVAHRACLCLVAYIAISRAR